MTKQERCLPDELLIKQGAEALAYKSHLISPTHVCLRKHRPPKTYRHPVLDARLTTHRILAEGRLLQKLRRSGVSVPAVFFLDLQHGDLWMEFIEGQSLHDLLLSRSSSKTKQEEEGDDNDTMMIVMAAVGREIAAMHDAECVHGDLTTSNILWTPEGRAVVIDLGLGAVSLAQEDQAVDLYVLERAFLATHPSSEHHFRMILHAYGQHKRHAPAILKKLEGVRLRGRKRTMVG